MAIDANPCPRPLKSNRFSPIAVDVGTQYTGDMRERITAELSRDGKPIGSCSGTIVHEARENGMTDRAGTLNVPMGVMPGKFHSVFDNGFECEIIITSVGGTIISGVGSPTLPAMFQATGDYTPVTA